MIIAFAASLLTAIPQETDASSLDFWAGKWVADSTRPQPDGTHQFTKGLAKNHILKIKGGKVIHENFTMPGFNGESWSVFSPKDKKWRQTWVDDSAGYITLEGGMEDDEFVLTSLHPNTTSRMRFTEIKPDSFVWLWEQKTDKGWQLSWRLDYHREK